MCDPYDYVYGEALYIAKSHPSEDARCFARAVANMIKSKEMPCIWTLDHDDEWMTWHTSCGEAYIVNEGTPAGNGMRFCCYCGGRLEEKK